MHNVREIWTSPIWKELIQDAAKIPSIRELLADTSRNEKLRLLPFEDICIDLTRNRISSSSFSQLLELATQMHIPEQVHAMFRGEKVNTTEQRPALHIALRSEPDVNISIEGHNVIPDVQRVLEQMERFVEKVHNKQVLGSTGRPIRNIISIGIGGSNLGPEMACRALGEYALSEAPHIYFVSNVDGSDMNQALNQCDVEETLILIASKTFTTNETMKNAQKAKKWIIDSLTPDAVPTHMIAISANPEKVKGFGINPDEHMFEFWDWVGGRFSLTSAIGLPLLFLIGKTQFQELLTGAREMDNHYLTASPEKNVPLLLALIQLWNTCALHIPTHGIIAYDERLDLFGLHLQQLIMESLGKQVTHEGQQLSSPINPFIFSGIGTNAQHSFFQQLHQGQPTSVDFIGVATPTYSNTENTHETLLGNMIAQANVLARGITKEELVQEGAESRLIPHRIQEGNRPSNIILLERLTPRTLGRLVALYEHIVHAYGVLLNINPFDQFGVEAGKKVANTIVSQLTKEPLIFDSIMNALKQ